MGFWSSKKEEREEEKEYTQKIILQNEIDNLDFNVPDEISNLILTSFDNGLSLESCRNYIKLLESKKNSSKEVLKTMFYASSFVNDNIFFNNIMSIVKNDIDFLNTLNYIISSRGYYSSKEEWEARIYSVILNNENYNKAIEEDRMRVGIYTNISQDNMDKLNEEINKLSTNLSSIKTDIEKNSKKVNEVNKKLDDTASKNLEKVKSISREKIKIIEDKSTDVLSSIDRAINIKSSSRSEILKEVQKQYDVIDAFNEKTNIKERYDRLISMKDAKLHYHPKFDDVLKHILVGNTVCLDGPEKCGKTQLVKQLAVLLGLSLSNIGNVYDEITQINGYYDFNTNYNKSPFQEKFENGGIVLMKNINTAPVQAISSLNGIISNFSYNPYIFGDKKLTTPNKNFRLIMTNNFASIAKNQIDNVVTIKMDYDTEFEKSLTKNDEILNFLFELRNSKLKITTSTFINVIHNLDLGLFDEKEVIRDFIASQNPIDMLNTASSKINQNNRYSKALKKVINK